MAKRGPPRAPAPALASSPWSMARQPLPTEVSNSSGGRRSGRTHKRTMGAANRPGSESNRTFQVSASCGRTPVGGLRKARCLFPCLRIKTPAPRIGAVYVKPHSSAAKARRRRSHPIYFNDAWIDACTIPSRVTPPAKRSASPQRRRPPIRGLGSSSSGGRGEDKDGDGEPDLLGDTWLYVVTGWTESRPRQRPRTSTRVRNGDNTTGDVVLLVVRAPATGAYLDDAWTWNGIRWTLMPRVGVREGKSAQAGHALASTPACRQTSLPQTRTSSCFEAKTFNSIRRLVPGGGSQWIEWIGPLYDPDQPQHERTYWPTPRYAHAIAYDEPYGGSPLRRSKRRLASPAPTPS